MRRPIRQGAVRAAHEWGLPPQFENGIVPEDLLGNRYGHQIHFWDLSGRRNVQTIDLGANHQMALEVRPAHDPAREYGFLGVVVDTTNLEGSIWTWWRENGKFQLAPSFRPLLWRRFSLTRAAPRRLAR